MGSTALLEEEKSKLKRIVADLSLDKAMLQDVIRQKALNLPAAPYGRSCALDLAGEHSTCLPCAALPVERSTYHYRSRRAGQAVLTNGSRRLRQPASATAIGGFMFCCAGKAGG
jgi:hypothetical protein